MSVHEYDYNFDVQDLASQFIDALDRANPDDVRRLITAGADVNAPCNGRTPPIHFAIGRNNYEIFSMLLESGAKLDAKNRQNLTAPEDLKRMIVSRDLNSLNRRKMANLIGIKCDL